MTVQLGDAVRVCFQKYATFSGRAGRPEFWYFALFTFLVSLAAELVDMALFPQSGLVGWLFSIATLLPSVAVGSRRLHDTERSGWLQLIGLTVIGLIPLIVWWASKGTPGANRHGLNPIA